MKTIEIKTNLSGEELQVLMWELEAFCEGKRMSKPVLRQPDVSGELNCEHEWLNHSFDHFGILQEQICDKCGLKEKLL